MIRETIRIKVVRTSIRGEKKREQIVMTSEHKLTTRTEIMLFWPNKC